MMWFAKTFPNPTPNADLATVKAQAVDSHYGDL